MNTYDQSKSEARRQLRRSLEKGIADNTPDHVQLKDIMLGALVVIAAAVSFTDFTLSLGTLRKFTALSLFLFVITTMIYRNRYDKGKQRGRCDEEYNNSLNEYREKRKDIYDRGLAGTVPEFCKQYKLRELREYRESLLADIDMEYDEYREKYQRKTAWAILTSPIPWSMKTTLIRCNRAKPLKLAPGLILNESGEMNREKLFGQSGKERERKDKKRQIVSRAAMVLFGGVIAIDVILNFSIITLFQWFVRMIPVISAIIMGDDDGFACVTVTETNFKNDQVAVIHLFHEFIRDNVRGEGGEIGAEGEKESGAQ